MAAIKFELLVVGKLKDSALEALCADYARRIRRYAQLDILEVKNDRALLGLFPRDGCVVALEVRGRSLTSSGFAQTMQGWVEQGHFPIAFVIGGAEGIPPAVRNKAALQLSLSSMTLPHRLARLVLLEQIYRAMTIWRNEPYAREN